jgi:uncharacterized protein GlcG (DUF336 family)
MTMQLTSGECKATIEGATHQADALGVTVSVAVVDAGGNLQAFLRMDGAEIAGPALAVDKAYTAAAHRVSTAELAIQAAPGGPLFGLHANGGGRYVIFGGGIPVFLEGELLGAVGVSGATVEHDVACAAAGLAAAETALRRRSTSDG